MTRGWRYRGFTIESNPKGTTYAYLVWVNFSRVLAGRTLAEIEAEVDRLIAEREAVEQAVA